MGRFVCSSYTKKKKFSVYTAMAVLINFWLLNVVLKRFQTCRCSHPRILSNRIGRVLVTRESVTIVVGIATDWKWQTCHFISSGGGKDWRARRDVQSVSRRVLFMSIINDALTLKNHGRGKRLQMSDGWAGGRHLMSMTREKTTRAGVGQHKQNRTISLCLSRSNQFLLQ